MPETTNLKLHLTDDPQEHFIDWREAMNGVTDSNMTKIDDAVGKLQDALTFDDVPAENSANPVKSGGVWEGLRRKANPNLLDNWYFVDPVNQRGQREYAGVVGGYTIDRWCCAEYGDNRINIKEDGLEFPVESTTLIQKIVNRCKGRRLTASLLTSDNELKSVTFTNTGNGYSPAESFTGMLTFDVLYNEDLLYFRLYSHTGYKNMKRVLAVKLELGDTQTLAHREGDTWVLNEIPDYGTELLKCQRYYQVFATEERRPAEAEDFRPVMRVRPVPGTVEINGRTYYTADANL